MQDEIKGEKGAVLKFLLPGMLPQSNLTDSKP